MTDSNIPIKIQEAQAEIAETKRIHGLCQAGLKACEGDNLPRQRDLLGIEQQLSEAIADQYCGEGNAALINELWGRYDEAKRRLKSLRLAQKALKKKENKYELKSRNSPAHITLKRWKQQGCPPGDE